MFRGKYLSRFGIDVVIFSLSMKTDLLRENWSTAIDSLHSKIKWLIYQGT